MSRFNISALDHVAIGVADVERSRAFYARVLGFERMIPEWDVPVLMGKRDGPRDLRQGAPSSPTPDDTPAPAVRIMHIAFRVDRSGFDLAASWPARSSR